MAVKKLDKFEAVKLAKERGFTFKKDFYELTWDEKDILKAIHKMTKYRKPVSASGSTLRYFYEYLDKNNKG
jgi:hypothetical protein